MKEYVPETVASHPDCLRIALDRVRETLAEASGYPLSHVWSFRIADIRDLLAALDILRAERTRGA